MYLSKRNDIKRVTVSYKFLKQKISTAFTMRLLNDEVVCQHTSGVDMLLSIPVTYFSIN